MSYEILKGKVLLIAYLFNTIQMHKCATQRTMIVAMLLATKKIYLIFKIYRNKNAA